MIFTEVEVTAANVDVIEHSKLALTCNVISAEEPLGCVWYHEQTELSTSPASRYNKSNRTRPPDTANITYSTAVWSHYTNVLSNPGTPGVAVASMSV